MVFSSLVFLFLFLPIVLCGYLLLSVPMTLDWRSGPWQQARNVWILIASLVFYAWGEPILIIVMLASAVVDFHCGLGIAGAFRSKGAIQQQAEGTPRSTQQKTWLIASLCFGLGLLGTFKYAGFVIDNYNSVIALIGLTALQWKNVPRPSLPLGISFYTFQSMSYTIDVYRGKTKANANIFNYLCFISLFPQLIAGPIVRYVNIAAELAERTVSLPLFSSGVERFIIGLSKKVLIANTMAGPADSIFGLPTSQLTPGLAWIGVLAYTLQLYFDFSGYSDMAIGLGRMLGFHFIENFDYPYVSRSITEFWRRWHISLSTWFRDYLYIPLGGNRHGLWSTYRNLIVVFFLCGLWHGASWTFVTWGLTHGSLLVVERVGLGHWLQRAWRPIGHVYTMLAVIGAWVLFRSETLDGAWRYLKALVGFGGLPDANGDTWSYFSIENILFFGIGVIAATPIVSGALSRLATGRKGVTWQSCMADVVLASGRLAVMALLFIACAAKLSAGTYNPFIYFRF